MDQETREIIETTANLVALQVVAPIEHRLTIIETRCDFRNQTRKAEIGGRWKLIGLALAIPGWFAAIVALFKAV